MALTCLIPIPQKHTLTTGTHTKQTFHIIRKQKNTHALSSTHKYTLTCAGEHTPGLAAAAAC